MKNKKFEKWALPKIEKIAKIMLLEHFYPIKIKWKKEIMYNAIAGFQFSYPYQSLTILYTDKLIEDWKEKDNSVKNILVHEVTHALTDPFYNAGWQRFITKEVFEDEREKLTDHIANIVIKNQLI